MHSATNPRSRRYNAMNKHINQLNKTNFNELIQKFKIRQNERGEFYQRSDFIEDVENLLNLLDDNNLEIEKELKELSSYQHSLIARAEMDKLQQKRWHNRQILCFTMEMIEALISNPIEAQEILYQYGKDILSTDIPMPSKQFSLAQKLVHSALQVDLPSIELFYLDKEIKRAERLTLPTNETNERKEQHQAFVNSLQTLRKTIAEDLKGMQDTEGYTPAKLRKSKSNRLAKNTAKMLSQLTYQKEDRVTDQLHLKNYAKELPLGRDLARKVSNAVGAAAGVFITCLSFILIGAAEFMSSLLSIDPCGSLANAAIQGGQMGSETGKVFAGIKPYESFSRHLMFQPRASEAAREMSQQAVHFIKSNGQVKKGSNSYKEQVKHDEVLTASMLPKKNR